MASRTLVGIFALALLAAASAHQCIHDRLAAEHEITVSEQNYPSVEKRADVYERMHIGFDISNLNLNDKYTCTRVGQSFSVGTGSRGACNENNQDNCVVTCTDKDVLTSAGISYIINKLLKTALTTLEDRLSIVRPTGGVTLTRATCGSMGGVTVANNYKTPSSPNIIGNWPNYDLVIFVTGRPVFGNTIAWALSCETDQKGRPISGHINIGTRNINLNNPLNDNYNIRVVVHELTHVLGFSGGLPAYNNLLRTKADSSGRSLTYVTSPTVLTNVRAQYGCPTMFGAPIEDSGGSGTAGSHWEKRIFRNEYMTGSAEQNAVISAVSLALFEDLGFYKADYSKAEVLAFGLNAGCTVAEGSCKNWPSPWSICTDDPNSQRPPRCTADGLAQAYCDTAKYTSSLPSYYQYFSDSTMGGSDQLADFCPSYRGYSNGDCRDASQNPNIQRTNVMDATGAYFSDSSRCFITNAIKKGYQKSGDSANCYPMKCDDANKQIIVTFAQGTSSQFTFTCPTNGGVQTLTGSTVFSGTFTCPTYAAYCGGSASTPKPSGSTTGGGLSTGTGGSGSGGQIPPTPSTPTTPCAAIADVCKAANKQCGSTYDSCRLATVQCGNNGLCATSTQVCSAGICTTPPPTCPSWCTSSNFATCTASTGACACFSGYVLQGTTCVQQTPPPPMSSSTIDNYDLLLGTSSSFTVKCSDSACSSNSLQMNGPTTSLTVVRWRNSDALLSPTTDTIVSMDVTPLSSATVWGIAGRVQDGNSHFFLRYEKAGTPGLYFGISSATSVTKRLVKAFTWNALETHTLVMEFQGSTIWLMFDDEDLNGFSSSKYTRGGVALLGSGGVVFSNGAISTSTSVTFSLVGCIDDNTFKARVASVLGIDPSAVTISRAVGESGRCKRDGTSSITAVIQGSADMPATHSYSALQFHAETASDLAANFAGADASLSAVGPAPAAAATAPQAFTETAMGGNIVAAQGSPAANGLGTEAGAGAGGGSSSSGVSAGAAAGIAVGCAVGCAAVAAAVGYKVAEKRGGGGMGRADSQEMDLYQRPDGGMEPPQKRKVKGGVDVYDYDAKGKHKSLTARGVGVDE